LQSFALQDYVATHVLTCLVPAFMLAGAMVAFINQEAMLSYLGEKANKVKSFSLAGIASFFVAACSCTVIPVSAGLYFSGAAIGVAFIVLWVALGQYPLPVYTGTSWEARSSLRASWHPCMACRVAGSSPRLPHEGARKRCVGHGGVKRARWSPEGT
jgi:hypothetical protein